MVIFPKFEENNDLLTENEGKMGNFGKIRIWEIFYITCHTVGLEKKSMTFKGSTKITKQLIWILYVFWDTLSLLFTIITIFDPIMWWGFQRHTQNLRLAILRELLQPYFHFKNVYNSKIVIFWIWWKSWGWVSKYV